MNTGDVLFNLVEWIAGLVDPDIPVIQANQSGPEPGVPYIVVNLIGVFPVRDHPQEITYEDDDVSGEEVVIARPVMETEWAFSLHAHMGSDPVTTLHKLKAKVELIQLQEPLFPALTIHDTSEIRYLPEFVKNEWQPRAQMDLALRGLARHGAEIDVIEEIEGFRVDRI